MNMDINEQSTPIYIEYRENDSDFALKAHHHNSYELIYVTEGTVEFKIGSSSYNVGPDHLIFINHLEAHELKITSLPYKRYFILIHPDYLHSIIKEPELLSVFKYRPEHFNHVLKLSPEISTAIRFRFSEIHREAESKQIFWETLLETALKEMLVCLYRSNGRSFPVLLDENAKNVYLIQRYIETHCLEELNLKAVSKKFYVDMYYLSHTFEKITGYNFKEYIILQRISKAKDLLYYSGENITNVCMKSGFNNVNHFIRIFRKYTGITPLQYRKGLR